MAKSKTTLKKPDAGLKHYAAQLEKQNEKLHIQIAKLRVENLDCENRVKAIEKEAKKYAPQLHISVASPLENLTEEQLIAKAKEFGYELKRLKQ